MAAMVQLIWLLSALLPERPLTVGSPVLQMILLPEVFPGLSIKIQGLAVDVVATVVIRDELITGNLAP